MCRKLICLLSLVLLLSLTSTTYADVVIGDFEVDMGDWALTWEGTSTIALSNIGATSGNQSLVLTGPTNVFSWAVMYTGLVDLANYHTLSADITWVASEWDPQSGIWVNFKDMAINSDGPSGWAQYIPTDTTNPDWPGSWDPANWGDHTRTLTWDISNYDSTGATWLQIIFSTNMGGVTTAGNYYIDNVKLIGGASAIVIDDFESYANTAALRAAWVDVSENDQGNPGISSATATLVTREDGSKAMFVTFVIPGGWDYPDANAPWDEGYVKEVWDATSDTARIELTLQTPINITADFNEAWQLKFDLEPVGPMGDLGDLNVYGIDESGAFGRTLIPCPVDAHFQWWYPPEWCPAYLAETGWVFPDQTDPNDPNNIPGYYRKYAGLDPLDDPPGGYLPYIYTGEWGQIICDDTRELNYAWGNVEMDTLTGLIKIALEVNSDTNLGEGFMRETEGGDKYPIKGGVYGFYIDNIELVSKP